MTGKSTRKPRIVVAGAGIAGSLITSGLARRRDIELICLERVGATGHLDAGTGLNVGPNAMKCLTMFMPEWASAIYANSLPWESWQISLTNGEVLMDLALAEVAEMPGIRIRWAELYQLLRAPIRSHIRYGAALTRCDAEPGGRLTATYTDEASGQSAEIGDIDLMVSAEGRYSPSRDLMFGEEAPTFLGVCLYRLLFPVGPDCPIGDYGQWFNGPNRLLAYRVPGDFVYCAGSFPIPSDSAIPDHMKTPEALASAYTPANGRLSREAAFLVEAVCANVDSIHWARLQEGGQRFAQPGKPILLVGDAAHPMVPTLGQGATQAIEDACVAVEEINRALDRGDSLTGIAARVEARRVERVRFVVEFSRQATDTMLAGADPVAGTRQKTQEPFMRKLRSLYQDVPVPAATVAEHA